MITIEALPDGGEGALELLGEPHLIKGAPAGEMRILKPVTIPGAGSYRKAFSAPLYRRREMEELDRNTGKEWGFSPKRCKGILARRRRGVSPKGYLRRRLGRHELSIPVYRREDFSPFLWREAGWLPVGEGYVTVVRRRVGYWVWLALAALAAFGVSYLFFTQGPQVLLDTLRDLPQTLSDSWYRLLHQWGLI